MSEEKSQRDRVRALVREVLANTPVEGEVESGVSAPAVLGNDRAPEHFVVNSLRDEIGKEFDRDESAKSLITEDDLRGLEPGAKLRVSDTAKFTPLAQDIVSEKSIELIRKSGRGSSVKAKIIAIGADHGGFPVKEQLIEFLHGFGLQVRDLGTHSTEAVDYPDFAHSVAKAVADKAADLGIIVDGAGIGSAIAANKVLGVRAAACYSAALAKNSREHNGANVLTLGSGQNSLNEIKEIVTAFLGSELTEERHKIRVGKIDAIERQYKK